MKMKPISIPEDLHAWLYDNINSDRTSLYAVIEWLRDCKEHCDREHSNSQIGVSDPFVRSCIGFASEPGKVRITDPFVSSCIMTMRYIGDTPKSGNCVGFASEPGKVRITNKSKAFGFVIATDEELENDEVHVEVDLNKLTTQVNNAEYCY